MMTPPWNLVTYFYNTLTPLKGRVCDNWSQTNTLPFSTPSEAPPLTSQTWIPKATKPTLINSSPLPFPLSGDWLEHTRCCWLSGTMFCGLLWDTCFFFHASDKQQYLHLRIYLKQKESYKRKTRSDVRPCLAQFQNLIRSSAVHNLHSDNSVMHKSHKHSTARSSDIAGAHERADGKNIPEHECVSNNSIWQTGKKLLNNSIHTNPDEVFTYLHDCDFCLIFDHILNELNWIR